MRLLKYIDETDELCFVNVDDISCIIESDQLSYRSLIYTLSDPEHSLPAKYKPSVVVEGDIVEL